TQAKLQVVETELDAERARTAKQAAKLTELQLAYDIAESARRDLAHTLSSVYASRSWRVTQPMRPAGNFCRGLPSAGSPRKTILPPWLRRNVRCAGNATLNFLPWRGAGWRARFTIRPRSPHR